jgi:ERF superfamily
MEPQVAKPPMGALAEALSKAQGQIEDAKRDSQNPFFKSSYADLASVWAACRKALAVNGLAVIQTTEFDEARIVLRTTLLHTSGERMESLLPVQPVRQIKDGGWVDAEKDPQAMGSAITYARRYSLAAIVGVAPAGDDDDGEGATGRGASAKEHAPAPAGPAPKIDPCPKCSNFRSVIVSKFQAGQLVCYKANGGCGHKWFPGGPQTEPGAAEAAEMFK